MRRIRLMVTAVALSAALGLTACSSDGTSPLEPQAPPAISQHLVGDLLNAVLLNCSPLPYLSKSASVGPLGGVLDLGVYKLVIPPGALKNTTTIQGEVIAGKHNTIRFSPHGLKFSKDVVLTMSYANCSGLGMLLPKRIVYTDEGLNLLELIRSLDLFGRKTVTGAIDHFSRYAIAY